MQGSAQALKEEIWSKLEVVFNRYKNSKGQINIPKVQEFIVDVLGHHSQQEVDYVMKNLFRLDSDGSGQVSFVQLGNFLFKRHCGQMSLQREHKIGKMTRGAERKMTLPQFTLLINKAYSFLNVTFQDNVSKIIFDSVDTDRDQLITYVQYFQVIERYICKNGNYKAAKSDERPKEEVKPNPSSIKPANQGPERFSKLRKHIWTNLRKLYDAFVRGRSLGFNDAEIKQLLLAIVPDLNQSEIDFLLAGLLCLNYKTIEFEPFAIVFIYLIGELGVSRYAENNSVTKKTLNRDEFVRLLKNTFKFLRLDPFKNSILYKIFEKIDKNHDGLITFDQYLDWVKRFLAVLKYFGDQFYVSEDDDEKDSSDPYDKTIADIKPRSIKFIFSDYTFAKKVRARVFQLLIPYDRDRDNEFSHKQINEALTGLMNQTEIELQYVTKNVFRYDRDNDKSVTYDELTNFCVEWHFGELAIQRLHRKDFYSNGAQRVMSRQQFGKTINKVLQMIQMSAPQNLLDLLFSEVDLDKDGWITYQVYFLFLRYYFGGFSLAALQDKNRKPNNTGNNTGKDEKPVALSEDQKLILALKDLNPFDRFVKILLSQSRSIFYDYDANKNLKFELDQIRQILEKVFGLTAEQIDYILFNYSNIDLSKGGSITFDQLIWIILSIYFIEILFNRKYKGNSGAWKTSRINLEQFITLITEACFFIRVKPDRDTLTYIFKELDTDRDGYITFQQYSDFIKKYLGNNIEFVVKPKNLPPANTNGISEEELSFIGAMWDELKKYFDQYDNNKKSFLKENELKSFVVEILQETTQRQLDYVFWNLFRVDNNANTEVDFHEFAPFILNHAGQISLQRFHRQQIKGKSSLNEDELNVVFKNAYGFLSSIPKQKSAVSKIFARIQNGGAVKYSNFLEWVHRTLSSRYKK